MIGHSAVPVGVATIFLYGGKDDKSAYHPLSILNTGNTLAGTTTKQPNTLTYKVTFAWDRYTDISSALPVSRFGTAVVVDNSTLYIFFGTTSKKKDEEKKNDDRIVDIDDAAPDCQQLGDVRQVEIIVKGKTKKALESGPDLDENNDTMRGGFSGVVNLGNLSSQLCAVLARVCPVTAVEGEGGLVEFQGRSSRVVDGVTLMVGRLPAISDATPLGAAPPLPPPLTVGLRASKLRAAEVLLSSPL